MSNDTVVSLAAPARVSDPLTELLRTGARRADRGRGHGGVRGVPVGVRSGEAARPRTEQGPRGPRCRGASRRRGWVRPDGLPGRGPGSARDFRVHGRLQREAVAVLPRQVVSRAPFAPMTTMSLGRLMSALGDLG